MNAQYPSDVIAEVELSGNVREREEEIKVEMERLIDQTAIETNHTVERVTSYSYLTFPALSTEEGFEVTKDAYSIQGNQSPAVLYWIDQDNYNGLTGEDIALKENEVYVHGTNKEYTGGTLSIMGHHFSATGLKDIEEFVIGGDTVSTVNDSYYIIVDNIDVLNEIAEQQKEILEEFAVGINTFTQIDLEYGIENQQEIGFGNQLRSNLDDSDMDVKTVDTRASANGKFMALRGGVLFLVLNLAILLLVMTVLIIYYKQISEAYDDKERFGIMQKVGLDQLEIKNAIKSQILTVFFLPVIVTGLHVLVMFPIMKKVMVLVILNEVSLFPISILSSYLIFLVAYVIIYRITARVYYKIVK